MRPSCSATELRPSPARTSTGPKRTCSPTSAKAGADVTLIEDPHEAVKDADLVITDTWVSMGDTDASERRRVLKPYRSTPI